LDVSLTAIFFATKKIIAKSPDLGQIDLTQSPKCFIF